MRNRPTHVITDLWSHPPQGGAIGPVCHELSAPVGRVLSQSLRALISSLGPQRSFERLCHD